MMTYVQNAKKASVASEMLSDLKGSPSFGYDANQI